MSETKLCNICKTPLDSSPEHRDCGGDCLTCMANAGDTDCEKSLEFIRGYRAATKLLRSDQLADRYGIGNMCSQWTAEDVADDLDIRIKEVL